MLIDNLLPIRRPAFVRALALSLILLLLAVANGLAQANTESDVINEPIFTVCEQPPQFPSGTDSLQTYLRENLQYSPPTKTAKSGQVLTQFIVRKDGRITDVKILKGLGRRYDKEAVRLISAMPNWQPGRQSGHLVNVELNLLVSFHK